MTKKELFELFHKAVNFNLYHQTRSFISHVYRVKFKNVFDDIFTNKNGIMYSYSKNFGGDEGSTLNGRINGLFFSTFVHPTTGLPLQSSYFGDTRITIPFEVLINDESNMYFSDFYCHYTAHKIQIVVAINNTLEDEFCKRNLIYLNKYDNPFFVIKYGTNIALVRNDVSVELFFAGNLHIRTLLYYYPHTVKLEYIKCIGDAKKAVVGIPKNPDCKFCNLDRVIERKQLHDVAVTELEDITKSLDDLGI